jgi:NarL family two-component system response regulator LiaR
MIVRRGLHALLANQEDVEVIGEAENGVEAIRQAVELLPDVILMDLIMPVMNGVDAINEIKKKIPGTRILVLSSFGQDDKVFPAIKAGASGYLLKDTLPHDLVQAIRDIHEGRTSLHPTIATRLIQELGQNTTLVPTGDALTDREVDVLKLVAHGLSNLEIADALVISERTVCAHISNILNKLHLANRTQAALYALREGLTSLYSDPSIRNNPSITNGAA